MSTPETPNSTSPPKRAPRRIYPTNPLGDKWFTNNFNQFAFHQEEHPRASWALRCAKQTQQDLPREPHDVYIPPTLWATSGLEIVWELPYDTRQSKKKDNFCCRNGGGVYFPGPDGKLKKIDRKYSYSNGPELFHPGKSFHNESNWKIKQRGPK